MNMRLLSYWILLLLFNSSLSAQTSRIPGFDPAQTLTLRFENIGSEQGLPHRNVQALFQDHLGFVWLGTAIGLVKFDGHRFITYQYEASDTSVFKKSKLAISVSAIAEDSDGDLWIGCKYQKSGKPLLFHFNRQTEKLIPFLFDKELNQSIITNSIKHLHVGQGYLWIDAEQLFRIPETWGQTEGDNWQEPPYKVFNKSRLKQRSSAVSNYTSPPKTREDRQGRIWSYGWRGLYEWLPAVDSFRFHPISIPLPQKKDVFIFDIAETEEGWFWVFPNRPGYLIKFYPDDGSYEILKDPTYRFGPIFLSTNRGSLWFGRSSGRGSLLIFDIESTTVRRANVEADGIDFLPLTRINCMLEDSSGSIWIGTRDGPLLKYEAQGNQFHHLKFKTNNQVSLQYSYINGLKQDRHGHYWISSFGGGLIRWNRAEHSFTLFQADPNNLDGPRTDFLVGVEIATDGKIWFGEGQSAGCYDPATNRYRHYREGGTVMTVYNDSNNQIWLAKYTGGLRRYDPGSDTFVKIGMPDPRNPNRTIYPSMGGIFEDSRGHLWLGSFAPHVAGCFRFDPATEQFELFTTVPQAHDFHEDENGHIWIASQDGLYDFNPLDQKLTRYGEQEGLSNNAVVAIEEDDGGHLWIGTENGLCRFDTTSKRFRIYYRSDGLPGNSFSPSAYKNSNGELFFWGNSGVLYFHPDSIQDNMIPPKLAFTGMDLFGQEVLPGPHSPLSKHLSTTSRVELSHWQNDLTLHFAALHFKNPKKNQHRIIMENYDAAWRNIGTLNRADYTNLDPGRYTFRVKAANSDGIWNEKGIALDIVIHPPWYWNTWSKVLYLLMAGSMIYGTYQFQLRRQLAVSEARRLRELDEVKTNLYTNITHEFRTPLTVIKGVVDQIQGHHTEKTLIQNNSNQLLVLINQMLDLSKLEAGKLELQLIHNDVLAFLRYVAESFHSLALNQKINLNFYSDQDTIEMDYDPDKMLQILSNLISNAIKFTPEYGKVLVTVQCPAVDTVEIKIKDTGIGIPSHQLAGIFDRFYQADASNTRRAEGTGIGLALTKELVELMDGTIEANSQVALGTTFTIRLPITHEASLESTGKYPLPMSDQALLKPRDQAALPALESPTDVTQSKKNQPTLLLVEDNQDVMHYLTDCLKATYLLHYARNGREGVDLARQIVPDIIICDVMMPEKDGFELCADLKTDPRTDHIPIVLLTAKADLDSKLEGLEYGADAYLTKPFHRQELHIRLEKLIALRELLQAKYNQPEFSRESNRQREDAFVLKVRQLILDHLDDEDFGVEDVAAAVYLSSTHVYRKLKALTGKSTSHFIRQIRLQEAYKLFETTEMNVSEVAFSVGFKDLSYFSRLFSQYYGKTASETAKELRGGNKSR